MARAGAGVRKRVWRKAVVALLLGIVAIGSLFFWKRYEIALWYMQQNNVAQEMAILQILESAAPILNRDIKMTFLEKIFSALAGKRNEKERQTDALNDVRRFNELGFKNHWLNFKVVHGLSSLNGFKLHGFDFVLGWKRGNTDEVVAEFNVNFIKRHIYKIQINQDCNFFIELKSYVEKKAKEN
jgi:hypothetical protein